MLLGDLELIISSSTRIRASLSRVGETTLSRPLSSRGDDNGDPAPKNVLRYIIAEFEQNIYKNNVHSINLKVLTCMK